MYFIRVLQTFAIQLCHEHGWRVKVLARGLDANQDKRHPPFQAS